MQYARIYLVRKFNPFVDDVSNYLGCIKLTDPKVTHHDKFITSTRWFRISRSVNYKVAAEYVAAVLDWNDPRRYTEWRRIGRRVLLISTIYPD